MSKITFRADDDLVEAVEELDASKSEVMREALRAYLEGGRPKRATETLGATQQSEGLDDAVAERVDAILADRLPSAADPAPARDVNLHITVDADGDASAERVAADANVADGAPGVTDPITATGGCAQCGESLNDEHVYCPNCGEKATQRVFCECGDEVRADWAFCPHCGRRTTSADVLDR